MKLLFKCDDCGHVMEKRKMKEIEDLDIDMLSIGAIIPSGRCPKKDCDAGCYPLVLDLASRKVVKAIHAVWDALSDFVEEPTIPGNTHLQNAGVKAIAKLQKALHPELHKS